MQAVPSTELHCSFGDPSTAPPHRETGTHVPIRMHMYAGHTLPGKGQPLQSWEGVSVQGLIKPACLCPTLMPSEVSKGSQAHVPGARQSHSPTFTTLRCSPSRAGFVALSPTSFSFKVICCGCRHPWSGHSLPSCCCSGCPCSSTGVHHH